MIGQVVYAGQWYFTSSDGGLWWATTQSSPFPGIPQLAKIQVDTGSVRNLTAIGNSVFYNKGNEIWKVTGSTATLVKTISLSQGTQLSELFHFDGKLYFSARSGLGTTELWRSDGTSSGTVRIKSFGISNDSAGLQNMSVFNGHLYFSASDQAHGRELWKSDGTTTQLVRDIQVGPNGSSPGPVDPVGGLFQADDGFLGAELWQTDGTTAGTKLVANVNRAGTPFDPNFAELNGEVYFQARNGRQRMDLWRTSDAPLGAEFIAELISWPPSTSMPSLQLATTSNTLYFVASDDATPSDVTPYLWSSSDPSSSKTKVAQRLTNIPVTYPSDLTIVGESLYFTASTATVPNIRRIWLNHSDGSVIVNGSYTDPRFLTSVGAGYFFADGATGGLWRGLGQGAGKIADVTPVGHGVELNGLYYFAGWTSENGVELWRTSGTGGGTVVVKEFNPGTVSSNVHSLVNVNGTLYFVADHSGKAALWKSDGTTAGTALVRDVPSAQRLGNYSSLTNVNGSLFFAASDEFTASDDVHGTELWTSDGTDEGTELVYDVWAGTPSSTPGHLFVAGENLYFSANDGIHGYAPFVFSLTSNAANTGGPYFTQEGQTISLDASGSSPDATLFEWDLDNNGSFETVGQTVSFSADDDGTYLVTLRVTAPAGTATDTATIHVENLAPVARAGGVLAGFTDLPSNLRLWADDPSPVDQATGFDFEVDFDGDGTVDDVFHGPSGMLVSHTFSASDVYHPLVTAIDKDGGRSEAAEHRIVIIDAMREPDADQPLVTNLVWTGTNGDDHVVFTQTSATTVLIELHQLNGVPLSPSFRAYMFGINGRVIADGLAGNDLIDLSGVTTISAEIFGGLGQDTIFGTQAADVIYTDGPSNTGGDGAEGDGGEGRPGNHVYAAGGDDVIYGSRGRDYLDAGTGRNLIHAGRDGAEGRDTLIGAMADDSDTTIPLVASSTDAVMSEFDPLDAALADWNDHDPIFGD